MSVIINGNNAQVYGDFSTPIVQNYGVGIFNPSYIYTANTITINGNKNTVYGNGGDVTFTATASDNNTVSGTGVSEIQLLTLLMGGNELLASGNNNTLYGSIQDLTIILTGGNNNTATPRPGAGYADLDQYNISLGDNIIGNASAPISGNNEVVYGAMRDLSLNMIAGYTPPTTDRHWNGAAIIGLSGKPQTLDVGENQINIGDGNNDIVYGAMRDFIVNTNAPSDSNVFAQDIWSGTTTNTVGDNTIKVGNGNNDTVFGALRNLNCSATSGSNGEDGFEDQNLNFGMNTITLGNGNNDVVDGAMQDILANIIGGSNVIVASYVGQTFMVNLLFNLGDNILVVGNGNNDVVNGSMRDSMWNFLAGNDNIGSVFGAGGAAYPVFDIFNAAGNNISVGNGNNDVVFGSMQDMTLNLTGGNGNSTVPQVGNSSGAAFARNDNFSLGANIVAVGNGSNDHVYGTMQEMSFNFMGGNYNSGAQGPTPGDAGMHNVLFSLGGNMLTVGNGNNDVVVGDMQTLSISLTGGSFNTNGLSAGAAVFDFNTFSLGGDTITVGNGNNDVVFASMDNLSFYATQGTCNDAISGIASFSDQGSNSGTVVSGVFIPGPDAGGGVISFANTTVTIGNGNNDTVVADDVLNLTGLNLYLDATTYQPNTIQWGNNTITGGTGNDNYVFSLADDASGNMAMQGVDILTNFNPAKKDMLSFGYVNDANNDGHITAADLDTTSAFVNIHQGGVSGAILGVAAIFNQLGNAAVTDFQNAINSFTASDADTGLTLLQDVANYITDGGLAAAVSALEAPHGGLILEGQTTTTMGSFSQINALHALTVEHTAVAVHA